MKRKAFTLIELLVVIAIIAILMAIITPTYTTVHDRIFTEQCVSHLRCVWLAQRMYAEDTGDWAPSLESLVSRRYLDEPEKYCVKTGRLYWTPMLPARVKPGTVMAACVPIPKTKKGERPHGFGETVVVLRVGGLVKVER